MATDWAARRDKLYGEQKLRVNQVNEAVNRIFEGRIHLDEECASYPRPEADELLTMKRTGMEAVFQATKVKFWIEKYYNLRRTHLLLKEEHLKLQQQFDANHAAYMTLIDATCAGRGVEIDDNPWSNVEDDERVFPVREDDGEDVNDVGGRLERSWP